MHQYIRTYIHTYIHTYIQNRMIEQQKKKWSMVHTPSWKKEVTLRDYEAIDAEAQIAHSLKDFESKCKAEAKARLLK